MAVIFSIDFPCGALGLGPWGRATVLGCPGGCPGVGPPWVPWGRATATSWKIEKRGLKTSVFWP